MAAAHLLLIIAAAGLCASAVFATILQFGRRTQAWNLYAVIGSIAFAIIVLTAYFIISLAPAPAY